MTKAIVIAAGMGKRLKPLTDDRPKTTLPVFGVSLIDNIFTLLSSASIEDVCVVTGYKSEKLEYLNAELVYNAEFESNNILHSLMKARSFLKQCCASGESVVISYSDIYYTNNVLGKLLNSEEDITIVADVDWEKLYINRSDNPIEEGEVVQYTSGVVKSLGKGISISEASFNYAEFIGLLKLSPKGIRLWLDLFEKLDDELSVTAPFQRAKEWQKSYLTDFIQELIDVGEKVSVCTINNEWLEFDTLGDYKRVCEFDNIYDFQKKNLN